MATSISKIGILLGLDTAGLASGVNTSTATLQGFKQRVDAMGGRGPAGFRNLGEGVKEAFHGAHVALMASEGSLRGMGGLLLNLSVAGVGIAATFKAIHFASEGVSKAFAFDPEAMKLWGEFKTEIEDLALAVGDFLLPWIKMWLQEGTAFIRGLNSAFQATGLIAKHDSPEVVKKREETAKKLLEIEQQRTKEMETQARLITESINKQNQAWVDMGRRITEEMRTPGEILNQKVGELNFLANRGLITFETFSRAINRAADDFAGLGEKARQFKQITSSENAAVDRFTTAGFSATREAADKWAQLQDIAKQQLEEDKAANLKRDEILRAIKDGGIKVKEVTFL